MEGPNRLNRQFSEEYSMSRNVCVNSTNRIVHKICNENCCKIIYSHDLSSDNLNERLEPEECVPTYQCDKPGDYVFVDVGSNPIGSVNLIEEDGDICKVNSETLFADNKDIDYSLFKNVTVERLLKNGSKANEMHNHNLKTTVDDISTGNDMSGLSTNVCMANMRENWDNYDKKSCIDITTSTVVRTSRGFEKDTYVKQEKCIDVLVPQCTQNMSPEIKKEEMVYNEEISVLSESIIDIKLHPVNKVEGSPDISTNYSCILDKNSRTGFIVLSKSGNSDFQTECSEEVPYNSYIGDAMVLKPLEENETVQIKRESHLKLLNKVQTVSRTCSELEVKPQSNLADDTGAGGVEECNHKLCEDNANTEAENKTNAVCQHHRKRKSKNTTDTQYVCKVCDKDFIQLCDLTAHKCTHSSKRAFGCDTCGKAFTCRYSLTQHKRIHTGDRPYVCDTCGKAFTNKGNLNVHKCIHTGDRLYYVCDTCGKAFTKKSNLIVHKRIHTVDRTYICDTCGKAFKNLCGLNNHKRIHNSDRLYVCDTCGKSFTNIGILYVHKLIHTGVMSYMCDTCGKAFTSMCNLKVHRRLHTSERPYVCDTCGKAFARMSYLKVHRRIHTGDRPFFCDICGKAFTNKGNLNVHKRIHTVDRTYICDTCGKAFTNKGNLNLHIRIHTVDRTYICDTCGKEFTSMCNLAVHRRLHTSERPYVCDTCGKAFRRMCYLKVHRRIHTGERPYVCDICGKKFTRMCYLTDHRHMHTGDGSNEIYVAKHSHT